MNTVHTMAAKGFELQVDVYDKNRPSYPKESVQSLIQQFGINKQSTVLDLAAGTGKMTQLLEPFVGKLIAVEPAENMRKKLKENTTTAEILEGTAESIPLSNESVDVVVVAQAFHWFCNRKALQEIHRVLKKDGGLALIWNLEDNNTDWVAEVRNLVEQFEDNAPQFRHGTWNKIFEETLDLFSSKDHQKFSYSLDCTSEMIWLRILSKSYISVLQQTQQEQLKQKLTEILLRHFPQLKNSENTVPYPYVTDLYTYNKV